MPTNILHTGKKGRGAQNNPHNKFDKHTSSEWYDGWYFEPETKAKTQYIEVFPKTIVNRIPISDGGFQYSMNPYQGCEHGCSYCYARESHQYWGYSAGVDFESKILVKKSAPELLKKTLARKKPYTGAIMLSGNTDCYQPIEAKLAITRKLLEVFLHYKHPVSIITKNALIVRDIDILEELAKKRLLHVSLSITSLDESLKQVLEPRTSGVKKRLKTVAMLSERGIPVNVMIAPIIPAINSHEILPIAEEVAKRGALNIAYTVVRLNGPIGGVFIQWLKTFFPDREEKVLNRIKQLHNGSIEDRRLKERITGTGEEAKLIQQTIALAKKRFFHNKKLPEYDFTLFAKNQNPQLKLWNEM